MKILGISGSLRKESYNSAALRAAQQLVPPGTELQIFEGLREIPPSIKTRTRARPRRWPT